MTYKVSYFNVRPDRRGRESAVFKKLNGRFGARGFSKHLRQVGHKKIRINRI
jgi:hypothetical protein